jgi:hypothetical protein
MIVWTASGTDELLVETQAGSGVLSNDYLGMGLMARRMIMR